MFSKKYFSKEKGCIYFQTFIPNNSSEIRIIVIGNKAFAVERFVKPNDFRASGSGIKKYPNDFEIDKRCLKIAFDITKKLKTQSLAFDFVYKDNNPMILEISYGFSVEFYDPCPGYWDREMNWHEGNFIPQEWIIDDLLKNNYE